MIGIYSGLLLSGEISHTMGIVNTLSQVPHPDAMLSAYVILAIPLGISLGLTQSIGISRWKIPAVPWIIATALGWIIPSVVFSRVRSQLLFSSAFGDAFIKYLELLWILYPVCLLIIGGCVGLSQILVSQQALPKHRFWILSNALGLMVFGLLATEILKISVNLQPRFGGSLLGSLESFQLTTDSLWAIILIIALPLLATFATALPTGMILLRYGNLRSNAVDKIANSVTPKPG